MFLHIFEIDVVGTDILYSRTSILMQPTQQLAFMASWTTKRLVVQGLPVRGL